MTDRRNILHRSIVCMLVVFGGCSAKITPVDVVGVYVANHGKGLDEIEVQEDGTYIYNCRLKNGKTLANTNRWSLHDENGEPRITFNDFVFCLAEYGPKLAYWDVPVEKSWTGTIRIPLDPDLNYYFAKRKP